LGRFSHYADQALEILPRAVAAVLGETNRSVEAVAMLSVDPALC
jgi:hypothetical protein